MKIRSLAEVDGNRTRRTGIARPNRFEGGGAHQVPGHLHRSTLAGRNRHTRACGSSNACNHSVEGVATVGNLPDDFPQSFHQDSWGLFMLVVCWSPKGGSGTSVVTAAIALAMANTSDRKVLTVDLAGDLPAVFGIAEPAGPGLSEWLAAGDDVGAAALHRLSIDVTESLQLLTWGRHSSPAAAESARWRRLADHLANLDTDVVIDAGRTPPPELVEVASRSLLVIRPCYLGLHRATSSAAQPTGVILVREPGRALSRSDVVRALGVDVVAEVPFDSAIARAVDAGLLAARLPAGLRRALAEITDAVAVH